ncbi:MAG TPA: ATP-binding cassette domain-containing protein [Bryobacteraceae bacterium]|nr:ATP-binding cassette domain-containing protein [Bryobacteraceae bacterium]
MAAPQPIIQVDRLVKRFGDLAAVDDISFRVEAGEIFAFLGPNGAGKSTTIKMLITLLRPTSGAARIAGFDLERQAAAVRKSIGYVPQMISVDGTLTAYENLMLMARLYEIPRAERAERARDMLAILGMESHRDALVRTFSGGMIRKIEVGQAMLHRPRALLLDEPTTGLDPVARQNIWERLFDLRGKFNTTIFFSTHNMEEADDVSDRVAVMNRGKIAATGTCEELKAQTGKPDATLEDAFLFFTGNKLQESGDFREIRRMRRTMRRLG